MCCDAAHHNMITSEKDGLVIVWNAAGKEVHSCLKWAGADNDSFVTGESSKNAAPSGASALRVWDKRVERSVACIRAHTGMITSIDMVDNMLLSAGVDCVLGFWDLRSMVSTGEATSLCQMRFDGGPNNAILKVASTGAPAPNVAAVSTIERLHIVDFTHLSNPVSAAATTASDPNATPQPYHDVKWGVGAEGIPMLYAANVTSSVEVFQMSNLTAANYHRLRGTGVDPVIKQEQESNVKANLGANLGSVRSKVSAHLLGANLGSVRSKVSAALLGANLGSVRSKVAAALLGANLGSVRSKVSAHLLGANLGSVRSKVSAHLLGANLGSVRSKVSAHLLGANLGSVRSKVSAHLLGANLGSVRSKVSVHLLGANLGSVRSKVSAHLLGANLGSVRSKVSAALLGANLGSVRSKVSADSYPHLPVPNAVDLPAKLDLPSLQPSLPEYPPLLNLLPLDGSCQLQPDNLLDLVQAWQQGSPWMSGVDQPGLPPLGHMHNQPHADLSKPSSHRTSGAALLASRALYLHQASVGKMGSHRGSNAGSEDLEVSPLSAAGALSERLRWTPQLHEYFERCVSALGGAEKAAPKAIFQSMAVEGLTMHHIKSHLQKYRLIVRSSPAIKKSETSTTSFTSSKRQAHPECEADSSSGNETKRMKSAFKNDCSEVNSRSELPYPTGLPDVKFLIPQNFTRSEHPHLDLKHGSSPESSEAPAAFPRQSDLWAGVSSLDYLTSVGHPPGGVQGGYFNQGAPIFMGHSESYTPPKVAQLGSNKKNTPWTQPGISRLSASASGNDAHGTTTAAASIGMPSQAGIATAAASIGMPRQAVIPTAATSIGIGGISIGGIEIGAVKSKGSDPKSGTLKVPATTTTTSFKVSPGTARRGNACEMVSQPAVMSPAQIIEKLQGALTVQQELQEKMSAQVQYLHGQYDSGGLSRNETRSATGDEKFWPGSVLTRFVL
eukprot:gene1300-32651_t